MGAVYRFLDFLNQGVLPSHPERSESNSALLQYFISKARDTLSSTYGGDLVLWMLDHGVELPVPTSFSSSPDNLSYEFSLCNDGAFSKRSHATTYYHYTRVSGAYVDVSTVQHIVDSVFTSQEGSSTLHVNETVLKSMTVSGVTSNHRLSSTWFENKRWVFPSYALRYISGDTLDWQLRSLDSNGFNTYSPWDTTIFANNISHTSECVPFDVSQHCGHNYPTSVRHPDFVDTSQCEMVDIVDIEQDVDLPTPDLYGFITYVAIGDDYFFPAYSTTTMSSADTIKFLMSLPIQRIAIRFMPVNLHTPTSHYLFGDSDAPPWYIEDII